MARKRKEDYAGRYECNKCIFRTDDADELREHMADKHSIFSGTNTTVSKRPRHKVPNEEDKSIIQMVPYNGINLEMHWRWDDDKGKYRYYLRGTKYADEVECDMKYGDYNIKGLATLREEWSKKHKPKTLLKKVKKVKK